MGALLTQFMNKYAYTDFHELNADWLIKTLMEMINQVENFVSLNAIKYADPIQWDIVRQYEKNTVVIDPLTGTAYISVQPVPSGVALTRTEYWTVVFDLGSFVTRAAKNFSNRYEADTTLTATFSTTTGDWLVWGDTLYEALVNITAGDQYVVDSNIKHITMEEVADALAQAINAVDTKVGDLDDLTTTDKTSIVNAINEIVLNLSQAINAVDTKVGDLDDLSTTDKTSIVNAINEEITYRRNKPYINVKDFGAVGDGVTDDYLAFISAYDAATDGSSIIVPYGIYNLSANPDDHSKNITWLYDYGTTFIGVGGNGGLDGVVNGFNFTLANPYNEVGGTNKKLYNDRIAPVGGGIMVDSHEYKATRTPKTITGTLTTNSAVMTNVSSLDGLHVGDGIYSVNNIPDWHNGTYRGDLIRITSIDYTNNEIHFGSTPGSNAAPGDGWCIDTPYTGVNTTENFLIKPREWIVGLFLGADSQNNDNFDNMNYLANFVLNGRGGAGYGLEIDVNYRTKCTGGELNGIVITGIGDAQQSGYGMVISRSGGANWTAGLDIRNGVFGIGIRAQRPLYIHTTYHDNTDQTNNTVDYGIVFDNSGTLPNFKPLFAGRQLVNGSQAFVIARNTDSSPTGNFLNFVSADLLTELTKIDINGNITTDGYIRASNLRLNKNVGTVTTETVTGYITIFDNNNSQIKLAVLS